MAEQKQQDDGGRAFPRTADAIAHENKDFDLDGMTLLDYFAGQALAGTLAYPGDAMGGSAHNNATHEDIAYEAYTLSAAMIAEKRRREQESK